MPYISVVPSIRTPVGVECFDYFVEGSLGVRIGDLLRIPFRNRDIPGLVIALSPTSAFEGRVKELTSLHILFRFPAVIVPLLDRASGHAFESRPTILHSWLRHVPKRFSADPSASLVTTIKNTHGTDITEYSVNRFERLVEHARKQQGRILVLTPWQQRADLLGRLLSAPVLHADLADSRAWSVWTSFVSSPEAILITTRIGGWLSSFADTVIIDEPENDDFKQDELSPRLDARWLVDTVNAYRPHLKTIRLGVTPPLAEFEDISSTHIPSIDIPLTTLTWAWQARGDIEGLHGDILERIGQALEEQRDVVILHPIKGERSRFTCRDCGWTIRCEKNIPAPAVCPTCQGSNLRAGRAGKDHIARRVAEKFGSARITVVDLSDWHRTSLPRKALVVVSELSLIGGVTEDIRRKERLIIAFRRLASVIASAQGELIVQGPEELVQKTHAWLTSEGVHMAWEEEWKERKAFGYPPAVRLIKILVDGTEEDAAHWMSRLSGSLPSPWAVGGPHPVVHRSKTRKPRHAIHLIPPPTADEQTVQACLEPFAKDAIIDLDPIAFFG